MGPLQRTTMRGPLQLKVVFVMLYIDIEFLQNKSSSIIFILITKPKN